MLRTSTSSELNSPSITLSLRAEEATEQASVSLVGAAELANEGRSLFELLCQLHLRSPQHQTLRCRQERSILSGSSSHCTHAAPARATCACFTPKQSINKCVSLPVMYLGQGGMHFLNCQSLLLAISLSHIQNFRGGQLHTQHRMLKTRRKLTLFCASLPLQLLCTPSRNTTTIEIGQVQYVLQILLQ